MRVLILADGSSSHVTRFTDELRRQGVEVLVASVESSPAVDRELERKGLIEYQVYRNLTVPIYEIIREFKPDIVNAHFATAYGFAAARVREKYGDLGARWCLHVWGSDILVSPTKSYLHKRRVQNSLARFDRVFADSEFLATKTQELGARSVSVVYWGCESAAVLSRDAISVKIERFTERPLRLFAPRPHKFLYRNDLILRELAPALSAKNVTLSVPQAGDLFDSFMEQVESCGVSESVTTYAPLTRSAYLEKLRSHHMYLSAAQSDSAPVSLTEALASGVLPLVASHPGACELINHSVREFCCYDSTLAGDLSSRLSALMSAPQETIESLVLRNQNSVRRQAVYEDNIAETIAIFSEQRPVSGSK